MEYIIPTKEEVEAWLLLTVRHSCHVEYYINKLRLATHDPECPHDLVGPGNKFEWSVIRGFALQYRQGIDFDTHVRPSLMDHRRQYHHRMWNEPNPKDKNQPAPEACPTDMFVGAIDTLCSLQEPRDYQGGTHSLEEIREIIKKNSPHKIRWLKSAWEEMESFLPPDLSTISLKEIPNIGIDSEVYLRIRRRLEDTINSLFGPGRMYPSL